MGIGMGADAAGLVRRLRRIEGQVRGLQRMLTAGAPCLQVLHQIAATRAALGEVGRLLAGRHLERCLEATVRSRQRQRRQRTVAELMEVLGRLARG